MARPYMPDMASRQRRLQMDRDVAAAVLRAARREDVQRLFAAEGVFGIDLHDGAGFVGLLFPGRAGELAGGVGFEVVGEERGGGSAVKATPETSTRRSRPWGQSPFFEDEKWATVPLHGCATGR